MISSFAGIMSKPVAQSDASGRPQPKFYSANIHRTELAEVDRLACSLRVTVLARWKAKRENVMRNGDWSAMPQLFREFLQLKETGLHLLVARLAFRLRLHKMARISSETALFMLEEFTSVTK